ncbi:hypothetical protein [Salinibacter ruber]|jgi:hypothetical protein|uniref:hypothetical protein n=1 Tax=Salinibacter ruber TaxID=146919 RepID=UPI0020748847|nr:hypothetical protein [Salinibacter ruber]MCS4198198.1 hypothetical protein [Salinibacter ruber]
MDTLSEELLDNTGGPALDDFVEYAGRVRTVLRGARKIGQGVPRGVDFLRADVSPEEGHGAVAYAPVADMEDDSIRLFSNLSDGSVFLRTLPQPAGNESLALDELTPIEEATEYSTVPPSKAAPRLDREDFRALHDGVTSAVAWADWLRPYLEEIMGGDAPYHTIPATCASEDGGIVATAPDFQTQKVLRPDGSIFDVGQAGLMIGMGARVKHDAPDELDMPRPIRSRAEEISERERRREAELEAEAARREFAQ